MTTFRSPAAGGPATAIAAAREDGHAVATRDLRRTFGDRDVLQGIDVQIRPGEFVGLLGRSGSGKSTLLRALAGLDHHATGEIVVPSRRSVVFQDPRLMPWATVLDNVVLGLDARDADERGRRALDEVGLDGHERDWPKTLSGGEAQRAALARALVRSPQLLLLDEPFGALDALTRIKMHGLVRELCARHHPAVLLVTHDVDEALLLADRVLVLTDGVISLDVAVDIPSPRRRSHPRFLALRPQLLAELGVDETADGEPAAPPPSAPAVAADVDPAVRSDPSHRSNPSPRSNPFEPARVLFADPVPQPPTIQATPQEDP